MYRQRIISPNTRNRRANMMLYGSPNSPDDDKVTWKDAPFLGLEINSARANNPDDDIYFQRSTLFDRENYNYIQSRLPKLTNFRKNVKTDIDFNLDEPEGESLKRKESPSTGKSRYECLSLSIINFFLFILNILFIYSS